MEIQLQVISNHLMPSKGKDGHAYNWEGASPTVYTEIHMQFPQEWLNRDTHPFVGCTYTDLRMCGTKLWNGSGAYSRAASNSGLVTVHDIAMQEVRS